MINLQASEKGRSVNEHFGFKPTNEMRLILKMNPLLKNHGQGFKSSCHDFWIIVVRYHPHLQRMLYSRSMVQKKVNFYDKKN